MCFPPLPEDAAATPLGALPALVLDTETTGLDVAQDRVIEIGAVPIDGGKVQEGKSFARLVDPGVPIPPTATGVHGIKDEDVTGQPPFPEVVADFTEFAKSAGARPVVGYSIGFDIGVLKAEHDRHEMTWRPPRTLDVAHLVRLVNPDLPGQSLELVASWLGIPVTDRHRALGDAVVTAKVFIALIPLLRQRGIVTLAQAERASQEMSHQLGVEAVAGWHAPHRPEADEGALAADIARVDSFPYRHRVSDLMGAPPRTIGIDGTVRDALAEMIGHHVSSMFLLGPGKRLAGIVTERDILRVVAEKGGEALGWDLGRFAKDSVHSIDDGEFAYRALLRMSEKDVRHLAVLDDNGRLVGALTPRNILNRRAEEMVSLGDKIEEAGSAEELGRVWEGLVAVARTLVAEGLDSRGVAAIISRELRALTRRACQLTEREMEEAGDGPPPVPYAMLVLGSGGREESLLAMDQDNAIVFSEGEPGGKADRWLGKLAQRASDMLDSVGLSYCRGGVMASKEAWRKDLRRWRETVGQWIARSRSDDLLNCDIFFDGVPVHGAFDLAKTLRAEAAEMARQSDSFLKFLALTASDVHSPFGLLGKIKTEGGRLDLKMHGIMPIFSAARALALRHGVDTRTTPGRLLRCRELGAVPQNIADNLVEAHRILLGMILRQQLMDVRAGLPLGNRVAVDELSGYGRKELKWALEQVPNITALLGTPARV